MENKIFREKSVENASSVEQLNDYIRVANPGIWMVLIAIIVLLIGVCIWGIFGRLDTKVNVVGNSEDGEVVLYVKEGDIENVSNAVEILIDDEKFTIAEVPEEPTKVTEDFSQYALHVGDLKIGEWIYKVKLNENLDEGVYKASVVINSVSPMSFVLN